MNTFELSAIYDSRKSFYGKAVVLVDGLTKRLQSYDTIVAEIDADGNATVHGWYSQTTARHINEFLRQNGHKPMSKKQMEEHRNKSDFKVGDEVGVSLSALFEAFPNLQYAEIQAEYDTITGGMAYYLFNASMEIACIDEEECTVYHVDPDNCSITLHNEVGGTPWYFTLSNAEARVALIKTEDK